MSGNTLKETEEKFFALPQGFYGLEPAPQSPPPTQNKKSKKRKASTQESTEPESENLTKKSSEAPNASKSTLEASKHQKPSIDGKKSSPNPTSAPSKPNKASSSALQASAECEFRSKLIDIFTKESGKPGLSAGRRRVFAYLLQLAAKKDLTPVEHSHMEKIVNSIDFRTDLFTKADEQPETPPQAKQKAPPAAPVKRSSTQTTSATSTLTPTPSVSKGSSPTGGVHNPDLEFALKEMLRQIVIAEIEVEMREAFAKNEIIKVQAYTNSIAEMTLTTILDIKNVFVNIAAVIPAEEKARIVGRTIDAFKSKEPVLREAFALHSNSSLVVVDPPDSILANSLFLLMVSKIIEILMRWERFAAGQGDYFKALVYQTAQLNVHATAMEDPSLLGQVVADCLGREAMQLSNEVTGSCSSLKEKLMQHYAVPHATKETSPWLKFQTDCAATASSRDAADSEHRSFDESVGLLYKSILLRSLSDLERRYISVGDKQVAAKMLRLIQQYRKKHFLSQDEVAKVLREHTPDFVNRETLRDGERLERIARYQHDNRLAFALLGRQDDTNAPPAKRRKLNEDPAKELLSLIDTEMPGAADGTADDKKDKLTPMKFICSKNSASLSQKIIMAKLISQWSQWEQFVETDEWIALELSCYFGDFWKRQLQDLFFLLHAELSASPKNLEGQEMAPIILKALYALFSIKDPKADAQHGLNLIQMPPRLRQLVHNKLRIIFRTLSVAQ